MEVTLKTTKRQFEERRIQVHGICECSYHVKEAFFRLSKQSKKVKIWTVLLLNTDFLLITAISYKNNRCKQA